MKVYIDEPIADSAFELLKKHAEITWDFENLDDIDAMLIRKHKVTREDMLRAPKLKLISRHGIGCDMLDLDAAEELGIKVATLPGANAEAVAELAVSMMLALSRKLTYTDRGVRKGIFTKFAPAETYGYEAYGKTIGLIGTGNIGRSVARIMKYGYNMRVLGYSRHLTKESAELLGMEYCESLSCLLQESDYINISIPLTQETENLIDAEALAMMKKSAILVNTSRGGIVDEEALYQALKENRIFGAACDVFKDGEPPAMEHPLLQIDNFIATPHCGPCTYENGERSGRLCVENIIRFFNREKI